MPNATVRAAARTLPEAATRRAALGAIIAAGAAGATVVLPAATSRAIAASVPYEDAALFALLTEVRAIDMLQNEVNDAENAAYDRIIWPDRPSALNPRPGDHFLVRSRRAEFDEPDIRELRGLVEGMEKLGQDAKIDLPLNFHPAALRASAGLVCSPTLDRRKVEFSGLLSRRRAGCAGGSHEGNRGLVADCPMRPNLVVVLAPILQLFARVGKRQEPVRVEALGSQTAIERFDERVVGWLARP